MKLSALTSSMIVAGMIFNFALASEKGGPPKPDEVIGFWKMVPIDKPELNEVDPWPLPFQWFAFYEDGHLASMMSTEDAEYSAEQLSVIFDEIRDSAPRYTWQDNFLIVEYPDLQHEQEVWGMNIFRVDVRFAKKGDLMMTLAGTEDGRPVYYRHLTPIR